MKQLCYISKSIRDTKRIAKTIFKDLEKGSVICLKGDLGAGKTTFTKFLLKFFGVKDVVSSPTFTIVKQYKIKNKIISHLDLYRVSNEEELIEIGLQEILENSYLTIIEWPDIANSELKMKVMEIRITFDEDENRIFEVEEKIGLC